MDSLRALAATVVLLFHIDGRRFFFGWAGVDLFFVLSGYLITSIILHQGQSKGFLVRFYARRTLRIWPIYYMTVIGIVAINSFLERPYPLAELPYVMTYTKNIQLYRSDTAPPQITPLLHTWTLSLEEQFYLIWPGLVLLSGRRLLMPFCVVLSLISAAARGGGTPLFWSPFSERILLARCDGFALGGLLAAALAEAEQRPRLPRPLKPVLGLTAAFALAYLVVGYLFYGGVRYIGLPTPSSPGSTIYAFNLLFLGMVGLVTTSSGHWVLAPLRLRPLVYLGQISYALYLYHFPIYCAIDGWEIAHDQILLNAAIKLGTSVAAAGVSWSFIEGPILRLKERFRYDGRPPDSEAGVLRTGDLLESR